MRTHTLEGKLYALDPQTGNARWSISLEGSVGGSPALGTDHTVYVALGNGRRLVALDGLSGTRKWHTEIGAIWYLASPVLGPDERILVSSFESGFAAINGDGSGIAWNLFGGTLVQSSAAVGADGVVYFGSPERQLCAVDRSTGARRWSANLNGVVTAPVTLGTDGSVYAVVSGFNNPSASVVAVQGSAGLASIPWPKVRGDLANTGRPYSRESFRPHLHILGRPVGGILLLRIEGIESDAIQVQRSSDLLQWTPAVWTQQGVGTVAVQHLEGGGSTQQLYRILISSGSLSHPEP